jgi:gluconate kinase
MNKHIFFITGASGVGKTSLVSALKTKHSGKTDWVFLHFDSIKVPTPEKMVENYGSGENWQKEMTFRWIKKLVTHYKEKKVIIFEGQVNLQFIRDGFSQNDFSAYTIILVDCNEETMVKRLTKDRKQPELVTLYMKNWLAFLWKQAKKMNVVVIDTSDITKKEVVTQFEEILAKIEMLQ